jgi:glycosyltransferase involved in cell wall biosynthesis
MGDSAFDIAVITPTHNRATLIGEALDSVIAQTFAGRIEVAVVDDGSTDDTQAVMQPYLEEYGGADARVQITYQRLEKAGVVTARNTAIASTTAPLVAFLDSDDYWHPDKLKLQAASMADDEVVLSHTSFRYVDEHGQMKDDGPQRLDNPCVGPCMDVLMDEFLVIFSSAMVRRATIDEAARAEEHGQPFDPRWTNSQDYDLVLRCARLGAFAYVAEPLTLYRLHGAHGAMGNLPRAYGFHSRVQIDFAKRWGHEIGIDEAEARRRASTFVRGRIDAAFWRRDFETARKLCELGIEIGHEPQWYEQMLARLSRPVWMYKLKDGLDRLRGRK